MAKQYTAQEMRDMAENILMSEDDWIEDAGHMLRQAADELEREGRREKKYEYKILYRFNGHLYDSIRHYQNIQSARKTLGVYSGHEDAHIVRREVGEWDEVKNEEV